MITIFSHTGSYPLQPQSVTRGVMIWSNINKMRVHNYHNLILFHCFPALYKLLNMFNTLNISVLMTSSRNSPSETLTSKSVYESGTKVPPKPHLYRPASDLVRFVMITDTIPLPEDPLLYSVLYLPLWALSSSVLMRISSSLHSSLQKNFLFPDWDKWQLIAPRPPSAPV